MNGERTIGAALPRKEDYRLVTGQGRYLDDIAVPGCLHAHFVRSPHAHARIVSIDCKAAAAAEGVVAVVTGRELAQWTTPLRIGPPMVERRTLRTRRGSAVARSISAPRWRMPIRPESQR
jgi:aerobic carbon-monoxide dehydrogenase large subunit